MEKVETLTVAYCVACLTAGMAQNIISSADSQKIIKAVSGLYILLTVIHCIAGTAAAGASIVLPKMQSSEMTDAEAYQSSILEQAGQQLAQRLEQELAQIGIRCQIHLDLCRQGNTVTVQRITVETNAELAPEQKQEAQDVLLPYQAGSIVYKCEANEDA